ncbi:MAG: hypothetical protein FD153_1312 [Rhodospirillaceae bacterium]|nr:MAG: hypothetical protein FD153_1312 [Rhodospirillaceae bacterium]
MATKPWVWQLLPQMQAPAWVMTITLRVEGRIIFLILLNVYKFAFVIDTHQSYDAATAKQRLQPMHLSPSMSRRHYSSNLVLLRVICNITFIYKCNVPLDNSL